MFSSLCVKLGDPSCIGFEISCGKTDRQRENPALMTAIGMDHITDNYKYEHKYIQVISHISFVWLGSV